ncbi:Zn-dependent protease (includes SpoIVFB) [Quadrisphaera granulorum]|uniref:Zinc metalloprotease n=1 Tax=Quadrisphaera granulorum TaxID=317664 RepID=A0A316A7H1_9ACTN|nr:site-2 protease family protein [Quadrisphaera granulorum]PWJ53158.1 Zn-dependent protease [Quadrisphaera granulorum]SZE97090.1 Zn-dependent protease (includes SpoIVFB) [Quadrisphaera granulorum]
MAGATSERSEGLVLGRLLGVPVILARSWFVIAVVITLLFHGSVVRTAPDLGPVASYAVAFCYAVLLGVSVLVHELAHALVARSFGLPATRIVLTLWGGHTQFESDLPSPGRSFAVAVAGPVANGLLAVLAWLPLQLADVPPLPSLLLFAAVLTNAFVAVFNVLPGLPLDGGRLLEAVVWRLGGDRDLGTLAAGWAGRVLAVVVPVVALGWPLLEGSRPDIVTAIWACALGALLWTGAGGALQGANIRRRAPRARARDLARPAVGVPADASLAHALEIAAAAGATAGVSGGAWVVLVGPDGRPAALLDPDAVSAVPPDRRALVPASSAARALLPGTALPDHLTGTDLLRAMSGQSSEEWVLIDAGGAVSGLLLARDVVAVVMGSRAQTR